MRGRQLFQIAAPIFNLSSPILILIPTTIVEFFLSLLRHFPTRLGIGIRYLLLRRLAKRCGKCVGIFEGVHIFQLQNTEFGENISIHPMCYVDAAGGLIIGSDVSIAHGTTIMTTEHDFSTPWEKIRDAPVKKSAVRIGSDVWIGAGVKILAGVNIGDHVVVGAGAVVTKDIPSHSLAVGVPARVIKTIKLRTMRNGHDESHASF